MDLARQKRRDESASNILSLRDQIDRLFDRFWSGALEPFGLVGWSPAIDVSETENEFTVNLEMPGLEPKDIDISVRGDTLTVRGEKKEETEQKGRDYHRIERRYGSFSRSIPLPTSVDADKVNASAKNGVLTITLPKKAEEKAKKIEIKAE